MAQAKRIIGSVLCAVLLLVDLVFLSYSIVRLAQFRHGKASRLVLQAQTDDVIKAITARNAGAAHARLQEKGWTVNEVKQTGVDEITVTVPDSSRNADIISELGNNFNTHTPEGKGWTATEDDNSIIFKFDEAVQTIERERATESALRIIENRIDAFGVTYPLVERHGGEGVYQILVEMPGVDDPERVKNTLNADANLELRLVAKGTSISPPYETRESAEQAANSQPGGPDNYEALFYRERGSEGSRAKEGWVVLEKEPVVIGLDMRDARATSNLYGETTYQIDFSLTPDGAQRFGDATGKHIGDFLAIVLNNEVKSAATIQSRITDRGVITGSFTKRQAEDLALILRSGALPCKVVYLSEETVPLSRWTQRYAIMTGMFAVMFVALTVLLILINLPRRKAAPTHYPTSQV
ncbi:MAG TPA: hypothetical protein VJH03_19720 [Blastocatellia bacterium]|nr:hypothetical protein [Blastocatellia bacterium]